MHSNNSDANHNLCAARTFETERKKTSWYIHGKSYFSHCHSVSLEDIVFFFYFIRSVCSFVGISVQFRAGFYHNGSVVFSVKWWTMHCALAGQCWWDYRVCLPYQCVLYLCTFDKRSDGIDSTNDVYLCSFIVFTITPIGTTNQLLFRSFFSAIHFYAFIHSVCKAQTETIITMRWMSGKIAHLGLRCSFNLNKQQIKRHTNTYRNKTRRRFELLTELNRQI